jgi:hypothetical protein
VWGWGYDLNLYWVTHPSSYRKKQSAAGVKAGRGL